MTKFIIKSLLLLPIFAVLFFTSWIIDPANIRNDSYETGAASILLSGKNVANLTNFNERKLQQLVVSRFVKSPEVIVLGSSRSLPINSSFFPNKTFFNNSVSGASIEDYLSIYYLYKKNGLKPKLVIFGLDPWVLNSDKVQDRAIDLYDEYIAMKYILGFNSQHTSKLQSKHIVQIQNYMEFLSPSYFNRSFVEFVQKVILKNGRLTNEYWATDKLEAEEPIKIADGSYVYGRKERDKKVAEINSDAKFYSMAKPIYGLGDFLKLDQSKMQLLDHLISYLKNNGIEVMIFLPPYHPIVFEVIKTNKAYAMVAESENWYRFLANKHNIKIIGSYNPKTSNLVESDFFDGMHLKNQAAHRIFFLFESDGGTSSDLTIMDLMREIHSAFLLYPGKTQPEVLSAFGFRTTDSRVFEEEFARMFQWYKRSVL